MFGKSWRNIYLLTNQNPLRRRSGGPNFCHRIRKDFKTMNFKERYRFVRGLRTAATNPIYKEEYRRLCKLLSRIPSTFLHHMPQIFLPRHRWYLLEFENFLRQIDCRITIPYLDWSKDLDNWARGTEKSDVWSPTPHGLGGDGRLPEGCVTDGPFKEGIFYIPEKIGYGCLKRNFNRSCFLPSKDQIENAINNSNFTVFEKGVCKTRTRYLRMADADGKMRIAKCG